MGECGSACAGCVRTAHHAQEEVVVVVAPSAHLSQNGKNSQFSTKSPIQNHILDPS